MRLQLPESFVPDSIGPGVLDDLSLSADDVITLPLGIVGWAGYEALFGTLASAKIGRIWSWSPATFTEEDALRVRAEAAVDVLLRGAAIDIPDKDAPLIAAWIGNRRAEYLDHEGLGTAADLQVFYALTWLSLDAPHGPVSTQAIPVARVHAPWWIPCDRDPFQSCPDLPAPDAPAPSSSQDVINALRRLVAYLRDNTQPDPRGWWDAYGQDPKVLLVMRRAGVTWTLPQGPTEQGDVPESLALALIEQAQSAGVLSEPARASSFLLGLVIVLIIALALAMRRSHA